MFNCLKTCFLVGIAWIGVVTALPEPEAGLPLTSSLVRLKRQAKGGACTSSADCVEPNVCSKWGWCQWTKIYGEDGPSQGAGAPGAGRSGQCVTSADCASRVPYCSKLGFCHGGRLPFDEEQLEIEDGVFASPPQDQPQGYINNNPRKNSPIFQNEQRQPKKQKQQQRNKATNSNGRRSSSNNNNSNSNNNNKGSSSRRNNNNSRNDNSSSSSSLGRGRQGTTNQERRRNNNNTGRKSSKAGSVRARLQQQTKSNGNAQGAGCPGNRLAACEGACSQLEGISAKAYRLCNQECRERCQ